MQPFSVHLPGYEKAIDVPETFLGRQVFDLTWPRAAGCSTQRHAARAHPDASSLAHTRVLPASGRLFPLDPNKIVSDPVSLHEPLGGPAVSSCGRRIHPPAHRPGRRRPPPEHRTLAVDPCERGPLPRDLWGEAASLARQHGIYVFRCARGGRRPRVFGGVYPSTRPRASLSIHPRF
jgi:hypothetical protein